LYVIEGLEHVGIAVSNLEEAFEVFEKTLGLKMERIIFILS